MFSFLVLLQNRAHMACLVAKKSIISPFSNWKATDLLLVLYDMFAWLISQDWKYCWLICCERKILFIDWKSTPYKPVNRAINTSYLRVAFSSRIHMLHLVGSRYHNEQIMSDHVEHGGHSGLPGCRTHDIGSGSGGSCSWRKEKGHGCGRTVQNNTPSKALVFHQTLSIPKASYIRRISSSTP